MHSNTATPEPSSPRLFVPVRRSANAVVLRTFTDPLGVRTGVGFTSPELLRSVLGEAQEHLEIGTNALRSLLRDCGTQNLRIDPRLSAAPPAQRTPSPPVRPTPVLPRLRLEGFAA